MVSEAGKGKSLARAATFIMVMITISRLTGFVREMITARTFGRGPDTDAFFAAFTVPDTMYFLLIGGALSSAFIPVFTGYLAKDQESEGWKAASTFINVAVLLLLGATILGVIAAPLIAPLVAYKIRGSERDLLIQLMRFMFPAVFFTACAGLQMGIVQSYRDFISPAIGPIVYNLGIIGGAVLLGHRYGVKGMAVGVVVGALGNVLLQVPFVMKHQRGYRLRIDLNNPGFRKMLQLMVPTLIGLSVTQLNLIINQNMASALSGGSITALRYANRIMQMPLGIFAAAISQSFFPTISRQAARQEWKDFNHTVALGLRSIVLVTLPSAVALFVLRTQVIQVLFQKGAFHASDTRYTAVALAYYTIGLVGASVIQILTRAFYSLHDTATPVRTGIAMVALNLVLNLFFLNFTNLKHGGLALAFSIDGTINMLLLLWLLNRRVPGFPLASVAVSFAKGLAASGIMGIAVWSVLRFVAPSLHSGLVALALEGIVGVAVFGLAAVALRMDELDFFMNIVRRKRGTAS